MSSLRIKYLEKKFKSIDKKIDIDLENDDVEVLINKLKQAKKEKIIAFYEMKSLVFMLLAVFKFFVIFAIVFYIFYDFKPLIGVILGFFIAYIWGKSDNSELNNFANEMIDIWYLKNEIEILKISKK